MLYGYNLAKQKKFEVSVEVICEKINSEDYYVYVSKEDRDFHFNQNVRGVISDGLETT